MFFFCLHRNKISLNIHLEKLKIKVIDKLFFLSHQQVSQIKLVIGNIKIYDKNLEGI